MKRLTKWVNGETRFTKYLKCNDPRGFGYAAMERLAAYEDTGLEPEEIAGLCTMEERAKMADLLRLEEYQALGPIADLRELVQAEQDGRLVVFPREGTEVYFIGCADCEQCPNSNLCNSADEWPPDGCRCPDVVHSDVWQPSQYSEHVQELYYLEGRYFLSPEDAEAALEGGANPSYPTASTPPPEWPRALYRKFTHGRELQ